MKKPPSEYYSLDEIASQWKYTINDLLHYGKMGQLQICVVLESTLIEKMKTRPVNENDLSDPLFKTIQKFLKEDPIRHRTEDIGTDNIIGVYPLCKENVLMISGGKPIDSVEDFSDDSISYHFGLIDDDLKFQPIERKVEITDLVITHEEKLRFAASCGLAGSNDIGKSERSTWLKIIYLLMHELADHKPSLVKTDGLNILQFETILKKAAEKHDLSNRGMSNSTLGKIYNAAMTELMPSIE